MTKMSIQLAVARAIAATVVLHEHLGDLRMADRAPFVVFIDEFASMSRLCRVRAARNERGRQLRRPHKRKFICSALCEVVRYRCARASPISLWRSLWNPPLLLHKPAP